VDTLTSSSRAGQEAGPCQDEPGPAVRSASVAARDSYGRLLALLAAATSDLAGAEDALADAFERALRTWPSQGVPGSPDAWLLTVARNRLRDEWKSARAQRAVTLDAGLGVLAPFVDVDVDSIPDRRLELMLVCAHPAIERAVHTPLMLNTVLGFTAEQVGRAFSIPPSTMATRLVRAKKRIKAAGIPFRIPDRADLPARMNSVLEAVYGAYVIDWATGPQRRRQPSAAPPSDALPSDALPSEALHLAEVLQAVAPSLGSGVALAAVTAEVDGPAAGLATLDALLAEAGQRARWFQPAKATRAHLLDRLGRKEEAIAAYEGAISLTHDTAERQYLEHRRDRATRSTIGWPEPQSL